MLQKLNERIQGLVAWIIVILIAITFTLFGIDYYLQSRHESAAQAEVNGQAITKQAFELNYRRSRQLRDLSQMSAARETQLKQQVLDEMILNSVSVQAARQRGFEVNAQQANAAIVHIPQFQEDGHFSSNRYAQALNGAFYTPETFQQEVRQGMLLNQQRFALIGTAFTLPSEVNQFVKLYMQTRDYDYLQIPAVKFLKEATVSENDIDKYYQTHKKVFLSPEKVSIDYVRLSLRDLKQQVQISPKEIRQYYEDNPASFMLPAQWRVAKLHLPYSDNMTDEQKNALKRQVEALVKDVQMSPQAFSERSKAFVQTHPNSSLQELWVAAGQTRYDAHLLALTKPNQISEVIATPKGLTLFQALDIKKASVKPFDMVQRDIENQLRHERAQEQYSKALEQLSELSYQTPDSLAPVAKALHLPIESTELFTRHGGEAPMTQNPQIRQTAFSYDVLKFRNNSEPIQIDNDSVMVLRVRQHIPAAERTLVDVKSLIENQLARKKAEALARQFGQSFLITPEGIQQEQLSHEQGMAQKQLHWHPVFGATRDTEQVIGPINDLAFNLPKPGEKIGQSLLSGDYVIVRLKKIHEGDISKLDKEQRASITQQIEASYGLMDYDLYISSLMRNAQITKH